MASYKKKENSDTPVEQKTSEKTWKMSLRIEILMTMNYLNFFTLILRRVLGSDFVDLTQD
jgi:hypothetical protein